MSEEPLSGSPTLRRRLVPESDLDMFAVLYGTTAVPGLRLYTNLDSENIASIPSRISGAEICIEPTGKSGEGYVEVRLAGPAFREIFAVLAADLVTIMGSSVSREEGASRLFSRLTAWQRFMERYAPEGLSEQAQRGLFGELYFMERYLKGILGLESAVDAWVGPERADQDFRFHRAATEVKTTITANPQHMKISSERQLDDTDLGSLTLFHLSLDRTVPPADTLNSVVDEIRASLEGTSDAGFRFEDRLVRAGYLQKHREIYDETGYRIRQESIFDVRDDFPRLLERDMPDGVGNVRYSISLAGCADYRIATEELGELLKNG